MLSAMLGRECRKEEAPGTVRRNDAEGIQLYRNSSPRCVTEEVRSPESKAESKLLRRSEEAEVL